MPTYYMDKCDTKKLAGLDEGFLSLCLPILVYR